MEKKINTRCDKSLTKSDFKQHVLNKKRIKKCSHSNLIIISKIPPFISMGDLIKYLSDYGEIKRNTVTNKKDVLVEFHNHKPVEILLSKSLCINGAKLNVREVANRHKDKGSNRPNIFATNTSKKEFNNSAMSFENQLTSFLQQVSLTEEEIVKKYEPVCKELDRVFQSIFPKAKTYMFGSTVVGLGFKNCDLDLYLNIGVPVVDENDNAIGPHVITANAIFSLAEKTLKLNKHTFTKFVSIPTAKVPIIKFTYQPTNVQCDLSFRNRLAIYNSQLVKYYLSLDPRLRPFAMIIKYWISKRSDILITKYAMTLLIIFYFQQLGIIPTVVDLQRKCAVPLTVNGWQVNFNKESTFCIKNNEKNSSIPSLLQRFFIFYANYDFKTNVVCPFDGCSHSKDLFFEPETLPTSMTSYKEYLKTSPDTKGLSIWRPMCIQDLQELSQNVTHSILDIGLQKFQAYCANAAKIVEHSSKHKYEDLLANIFNPNIYKHQNNYKRSVKHEEVTVIFDICPNNFIVQKSVIEQKNDLLIKNNWFDLTLSIFKQYLEKVLNFNVEIANREGTRSSTSFEKQNIIVLHCTGNDCLWRNRKIDIASENFLTPLDKEIEITKTLLRKINLNDAPLNVIVNIECYFEKKTEPNLYIRCAIKDKGCSEQMFSTLSNHLLGKLPNLVKKTLNILRQMKNLNSQIF